MVRGSSVALVWAVVVGCGGCGGCGGESAKEDAPTGSSDPSLATVEPSARAIDARPAACGECHPDVVADWQTSVHAQAWTDPVFRAEYDPAPAASCRNCHDPPARAPDTHGIDCATCHVRDGQVLATGTSPEAAAAHPITVEPTLASVDACAGCHQFQFSDDGVHDSAEALQDTVAEWRTSVAAGEGRTCLDCHMPAGSHRLPGASDPTLLAGAVDVAITAERAAGGTIVAEVELRGDEIGHAFPTGDVFRQGRLTLRTDAGARETVVLQRWLARTADPDHAASHVRTVDDTRVPPPGTGVLRERVELANSEDSARATAITWTLELHRLPPKQARERGLDPALTVIPVAAGSVAIAD